MLETDRIGYVFADARELYDDALEILRETCGGPTGTLKRPKGRRPS